jgi:hypothetical protein
MSMTNYKRLFHLACEAAETLAERIAELEAKSLTDLQTLNMANGLIQLLKDRVRGLEKERAQRLGETARIADAAMDRIAEAESDIRDYRVRVFMAVDTLDPRCAL